MKGLGGHSPLDHDVWGRLESLAAFDAPRPVVEPSAGSDFVARIKGVSAEIGVTRLADLTGLDFLGLPVWAAYRPNGYVLSLASGKGLTHESARASALGEAMELDAAERHSGQIEATINDLEQRCGPAAVLQMIGVARCSFDKVARDRPLRWSLGINLLDETPVWVPTELVALDDRKSARKDAGGWITGLFDSSSSGLGAGNDLATATLHALLELVEEDAMALWRYGGPSSDTEAVEPGSFRSQRLTDVLSDIGKAGADCRLFDVTSADVSIPAIYAVVAGYPTGSHHAKLFGAGSCCHVDADAAAIGALLEAAQSRIAYISGARDDLPRALYDSEPFPSAEWMLSTLQTRKAPRDFVHPDAKSDMRSMISLVLSKLVSVGVTRIIVVPIVTPQSVEASVAVVRVIADGLEIDTEGSARQLGRRGLSAFLRAAKQVA